MVSWVDNDGAPLALNENWPKSYNYALDLPRLGPVWWRRHNAGAFMRKVLGCAIVGIVIAGASPSLLACGDKFLLIGRALKYQKAYASAHPGTILIYDAPGSRVGAVARELQLQQLLSGAGHKVQIVSTFAALEQAVKTTAPDIVLADSGDIAQLEQSVPHGAAIVSIAVLQTSKSRHPLSIIDDALRVKAKRAASKT